MIQCIEISTLVQGQLNLKKVVTSYTICHASWVSCMWGGWRIETRCEEHFILYSWTKRRLCCGGALTDCDRVQERLMSINKELIKQVFLIE